VEDISMSGNHALPLG